VISLADRAGLGAPAASAIVVLRSGHFFHGRLNQLKQIVLHDSTGAAYEFRHSGRRLVKSYGDHRVVDGVSLTSGAANASACWGERAGKTTTLRLLLGLVARTAAR